ncbi:leucine permease transcriptional regulator [Sporothrix brasiliensis 5110]|uniref:Leucine permease transcriptional regulator n=1 Tax=Sporothrix brasiliensis 5110 TaxID=1398154 RepID=A0A0C2J176_9PEZI|nr:leucine permease transcriptional regulator [Sporothrix brasiliensis 5110]KIH90872.1 leucine permease transcriptional regulator [Sporothrix brasiliensis 5110]
MPVASVISLPPTVPDVEVARPRKRVSLASAEPKVPEDSSCTAPQPAALLPPFVPVVPAVHSPTSPPTVAAPAVPDAPETPQKRDTAVAGTALTPPSTPASSASSAPTVETPTKTGAATLAATGTELTPPSTPASVATAPSPITDDDPPAKEKILSTEEGRPNRKPILKPNSILKLKSALKRRPAVTFAPEASTTGSDEGPEQTTQPTSKKRNQSFVEDDCKSSATRRPRKRVSFAEDVKSAEDDIEVELPAPTEAPAQTEAPAPVEVHTPAEDPAPAPKRPPKRAAEPFAPGPITITKSMNAKLDISAVRPRKMHRMRAVDFFPSASLQTAESGQPAVDNTDAAPTLTKVESQAPLCPVEEEATPGPALATNTGLFATPTVKMARATRAFPPRQFSISADKAAESISELPKLPELPELPELKLPKSFRHPHKKPKQQKKKQGDLPDPLYDVSDLITTLTAHPDRRFVALTERMHLLTLSEPTGFTTGLNAPNANGNGVAAPATSNPFGAPSGNPFKAASPAPTAPAFGSAVSSTPTSSAAAPANPFQAAINANPSPAFGTATAQPVASPFANPTASTPSPFQTTQPSSRGTSPNPFTALSQQPAPAAASPIGSTPTPAAASPFGNTPAPASTSPFGKTQMPATTATGLSGFQQTPATTGFGQPTSQATGFGQPTSASNPFGQPVPTATAFGQPTTFGASSQPSPNPFMASSNPTPTPSVSPFSGTTHTTPTANPAAAKNTAKKSVHFNLDPVSSQPTQTNGSGKPKPSLATSSTRFSSQPTLSAAPKEPQSDYAQKIMAQLQKDRLKPPQWPADPGNPANASALEAFWVSYGNYRDKVRNSLVKAGLIDDPKVRKRLDEAIDFKGICDEMCPEFEKIERIQQHNVMMAEKSESPDGTMWPSPSLMVKALTRSSAGQEAPLPMDVRTVTALKRTLDHLIDDVLGDDSRLPAVHNFLWDRTRAIRRDFIFHSNMSEDEMLQQIYCLETITRFHATSLHLLSQKGFAPEGFDQRQEREQLSKALLSLLQAYDDCKDRHITCRNECEFRAYFILLNAHDPNFQHKVAEWGMELWYASDDVQTAMTLAQAMQSIWDWRGPIKPTTPTTTALGAFATFFRIIESPQISYTMACVAEMHFVHVRRGILRNMTRAYARARDSPKDLTIQALNDMLRFDTVDEAWDFVIENKLEFSSDDKTTAYLVLDKAVTISSMPIAQSFSQNLVERKRAGRSLPETLHNTVYEDPSKAPHLVTAPTATKDSDLFVSQSQAQVNTAPTQNVSKPTTSFPATNSSTSILGPAAPSTTPASAPSIFSQAPTASSSTPAPAASIFSQLNSGADKKAATPSLFQKTPAADSKANATSTVPAASTSVFTSPFSTTPTSSPAKTNSSFTTGAPKAVSNIFDTSKPPATAAPAASIFSQPPTAVSSTSSAPAASVLSQPPPASSTSFSALFPASSTSAVADNKSTTAASPAAQSNPLPTASAAKKAEEKSSVLDATTKPSTSLGQSATTPATSALAPTAQPAKAPTQKPVSPPPPPAPKADLMGNFTKWFVLGDNGILGEFKEAFVEHLVRQTYEQFQRDEEERIKREEDEKSWAEALRFKTYNLRVKFFYRWRQIARERALDRRARQARDELKAYRAAKRAEQRAAAEKAAADEREKAAEARRMGSKEVKFLEELGYYGDFGASSRKRKASVGGVGDVGGVGGVDGLDGGPDASRARSVSLSVVEPHQAASAALSPLQQQLQQGDEPPRRTRLPVRSIKEGISHTVSRAKELLSSRATSNGSSDMQYTRRHRGSIGSIGSIDGASISGDSLRSVRSSFSPDGTKFAYYRRSIPGKSRAKSFFTRVPSGTDLTAAADATTPPKKMTNFMRYSKKNNFGFGNTTGSSVSGSAQGSGMSGAGGIEKANRWSSPGIRARPLSTARPATATMSPSPSSHASFSTSVAGSGVGGLSQSGGSKVKSSYWRLRAMGMVQMPNKQYLHESLALPMLQDGKRFPGVGNYGLPPVPTWQDADSAAKKDERQLVGTGDGRPFAINDDANNTDNVNEVNDDDEDEDESAESRARRYAEERMRRTSVTPSRKRMFSSGDGQDGTIGATASNAARRPATATAIAATAAAAASLTSPPGAKKARVSASPNNNISNSGSSSNNNNYNNYSSSTLSEAERIIQEMREMADAMDKDRDWYREQTELMKSGTSAWDE